jgi:hypothetical protein
MNLNLVKLSHYNIPHLVEKTNQEWISFGENNLYPNYLLELFLGSAINGALIKSIGAMIYGEGIAATNVDESEATKESYLRLTELLHNSDDDVLKDLALDLKLFGGCYVNVIWSRDRSKIAKMKHIPAQYIRSGKMIDGEIEHYYYSADWANHKKAEYKPRAYKAFDTQDRSQASQILMIRDKNPALFYGFAPDYVAATDWIQMELEIAQFHLSNITSGMTPSMHVGFSNGVPTDEERRTIERQLNQKFAGTGNAGKILITFNDGKETAPIIEPIQMNDAQSAWVEMSKQSVSQILAGHRVTSPILFGIRAEGGGLGNNADELRDAYSLFNNTVIIPFQTTLLKGLNKIFKVNDIHLDLYFKSLKPADFIDLEVTKTQSEEDQEKEGVTKENIDTDNLKQEFKDLQDIDTKPTKGMIEEAEKGLEWRREYGRGGTQVAVARATNIKNGDNLSFDTIKRMNSFFARHEVDKKAEGFEIGEEGFPSAGRIAWALWGGDAGQSWASKKVKEIEGVREDMFINVEDDDVCLDYFDEVGITLDDEEWFEAYSEELDEHSIDSRYHEFAYAPAGTPNVAESSSDIGMFRILYRYSQTLSISKKTGEVTSRKFCEKMVAKSKQGTLYRMEDLEKASKKAVNKGFGPNGTNTYNIALYKGGANCKHKWVRVFYFRRQVPKGSVFVDVDGKEYQGGEFLPNGTLNNFREVSQQFANNKIKMPDDAEMRKTTWKMKNHGFLKPKRETERSRSTPV